MNISVIGGDLRQLTLAKLLKEDGYTVKIAGFDNGPDNALKTHNDIWKSDVLIFPIPVSHDGIFVNAPYSQNPIPIEAKKISGSKLILGGNISKQLSQLFNDADVNYIDYLNRDELMIKNAIPTAEGAIEIALKEMPITLHSSRCLVIGYGRIGKILSNMLKGLGANVTVSARKHSDLAWISSLGYSPIHNSNLKNIISEFDVIFNTVPAMILDDTILKSIHPDALIIDLASKPGGVNFATAKDLGLKVIWSLGLPGKVAPITSGKIIKDTVVNILKEMEV